jgi:hypothetical protein
MALGIGYGLPFIAQHGTNPYKTQWSSAREGAKGAGATVEDENAGVGSCLVARGQEVYTDGLPFTPSLLIVPQFYKAGNLYSDVPPSVSGVDIPTPLSFTVTRATTATRVNSSGLIESVASGVPRIDWLGQSCPALLVEPSAQNLVLQSRDLSVSGTWSASGITAVRNAIGADGTASGACTLTATAASATITQNLSHASQSRIFSAVMRRVTGTGDVELTTNGGTNWTAVTLTTAFTQLACVARTVASGQVGIRMIASGDVIEVDFTQGEVGPVATSPIATTSGSITRNADTISASGALVSGLIGQTAGTIYCEFAYFGQPILRSGPIYLRQAELRGLSINSSPVGTPGITFISRNDGGITDFNVVSGALQLGTYYKIAIGYDAGGTAAGGSQASGVVAYVNGVQTAIGTFRVPDAAGLTEFRMYGATSGSDTEAFNGRIRAAALYTTRLSNDQLAELTRL